ncbi:hypothetical protein Gpo141_00009205 [Globisporangium polare]
MGRERTAPLHQQRCRDCEALREELAQLQAHSQQQARRDQQQCLLMFQQVQQLAKLNASLVLRCNGSAAAPSGFSMRCAEDESSSLSYKLQSFKPKLKTADRDRDDPKREHLRLLVAQQAQELKALHKKLESAILIPAGCQVEESKLIFNEQLRLNDSNEPQASFEGSRDTSESFSYAQEQKRKRVQAHLRQLPLTSLNAQLKSRDAEITRLQQLTAKLETQGVAIVDKKREMARNYQQITRVQQTQLKKYFALLRKLDMDKRSAENKLVELGEYAAVLERKLVASVDSLEVNGYSNRVGKLHQSHSNPSTSVLTLDTTRKSSAADYILNVRAG